MGKDAINIGQLKIKAKSKMEIYRVLTVEGKLYLPPSQNLGNN